MEWTRQFPIDRPTFPARSLTPRPFLDLRQASLKMAGRCSLSVLPELNFNCLNQMGKQLQDRGDEDTNYLHNITFICHFLREPYIGLRLKKHMAAPYQKAR